MACNGKKREKMEKREKKCKIISVGPPFFCKMARPFPAKTVPFQSLDLQVAAVAMVMAGVISAFGAHGVRALPVLRHHSR